jgi:hypothetical protein
MPVLRFSRDVAFDPEHVHSMLSAFDGACARLHLRKGDEMTDLVALKIVELAEADANRLLALVLQELESGPLQPL